MVELNAGDFHLIEIDDASTSPDHEMVLIISITYMLLTLYVRAVSMYTRHTYVYLLTYCPSLLVSPYNLMW